MRAEDGLKPRLNPNHWLLSPLELCLHPSAGRRDPISHDAESPQSSLVPPKILTLTSHHPQ